MDLIFSLFKMSYPGWCSPCYDPCQQFAPCPPPYPVTCIGVTGPTGATGAPGPTAYYQYAAIITLPGVNTGSFTVKYNDLPIDLSWVGSTGSAQTDPVPQYSGLFTEVVVVNYTTGTSLFVGGNVVTPWSVQVWANDIHGNPVGDVDIYVSIKIYKSAPVARGTTKSIAIKSA